MSVDNYTLDELINMDGGYEYGVPQEHQDSNLTLIPKKKVEQAYAIQSRRWEQKFREVEQAARKERRKKRQSPNTKAKV